jgi:hypothetical protein
MQIGGRWMINMCGTKEGMTLVLMLQAVAVIGEAEQQHHHDAPWHAHDAPWHAHDAPWHAHDAPWHAAAWHCQVAGRQAAHPKSVCVLKDKGVGGWDHH